MSLERYQLLYDGHCGFCRFSRDLIKRFDRSDRIVPLSFRDPEVRAQFAYISDEAFESSMHVIFPDGRIFREEGAVRAILTVGPWYLRWLAVFFYLPGVSWVVRQVYRWVARNRFRLSGAPVCEEACEVHLGGKPGGKAGRSRQDLV